MSRSTSPTSARVPPAEMTAAALRASPAMADDEALGRRAVGRVARRLMPLLFAAYLVNFLDRVNVGFAALQMNERLDFGPAVFGFGAGVFFLGYFLFEVPSNLVLVRVGARRWLARIMLSWGVVSAATALATGPTSFYALRFALGVAEAGFVPALLVVIATWFPEERRASAVAVVWSATAAALVLGGPLSAAILALDGRLGLQGWQWLFALEALPAVLLAPVLLRLLPDRVEDAKWMPGDERAWLSTRLAAERARRVAGGASEAALAGLARREPWLLGLLYFFLGIGFFGITFWLPQVVRQLSGLGDAATALVSAVPFAGAAAAMLLVARLSDRTGRRRVYVVTGALIAAAGFGFSAVTASPLLSLTLLSVGAAGLWSVIGVFWQLPSRYLTGAAAAVGMAAINACGSLGGFVGPYAVGLLRAGGGDFRSALAMVALAMLAAATVALTLSEQKD